MKKTILIIALALTTQLTSAQVARTKPADNNVKIPNEDIVRINAQRTLNDSKPISDTVRYNAQNRVNANINANRVNENSNAVKVDISSNPQGTIASPINSEPQKSDTYQTSPVQKPVP